MSRGWYIAGNTLVYVNTPAGGSAELGLSEDPIQISPAFNFYSINCDAYGGMVPAEKLWMFGTATITMTLVYFNALTLRDIISFSMGGGGSGEGSMAAAGVPMGGNATDGAGHNYFSLTISLSAADLGNYTFPYCRLAGQPVVLPLGSAYSKVRLNVFSTPYATATGAASPTNKRLWSRT